MVKPDYGYWAAQPEFSRIDAAFLCCDQEPEAVKRGEFGPPKVAAMYRRIADELPNRPTGWNGLTVASGRGGAVTIGGDSYVSRENLRQWAAATGQRAAMPFLFPEDLESKPRAKSQNYTQGLSDREEPTVLKILSAIIKAKYGEDIVSDLISDYSTRIGTIQRDVDKYFPMDEGTLRKYLKKLPL